MSEVDEKIDYMLLVNFLGGEYYSAFVEYCNGDYELADEILKALEGKLMSKDNLFKEAIKKYGFMAQLGVLQEECAELIVAASHIRRDREGAINEFIEELVDVHIMLKQVEEYLNRIGYSEEITAMWNNKLLKLEQRLKGE